MSEGQKVFGITRERHLRPEDARTVGIRSEVVNGGVYWVIQAMQRTNPELEHDVMTSVYQPDTAYPQSEDHQLLANAALAASLGAATMPETPVQQERQSDYELAG